jgi:isocitrate dehydrogenase
MKDNFQNTFPKMPELRVSKNGYEIRTDILAMAKDIVMEEYHMKFSGWSMTVAKDEKTGQVVTQVDMPEFPGMQHILNTAQQMYDFVNQVQGK